jgi:hypothetical protein
MAWTQGDLDALDAAMKGGIKKVTFEDGRSREFQDLSDLIELRKTIKNELLASSSQVPLRRTVIGRFGRHR